jgi:hypothetical protein
MISTTINVQWAETGFRICSFFMGLFTLLMVVCSIWYAYKEETIAELSILFLLVWGAAYFIPLLTNIK